MIEEELTSEQQRIIDLRNKAQELLDEAEKIENEIDSEK